MTSPAAMPEPLADSVDTAAYRLGCCRAQLYKEIKAGRIRVRKLGRRTLIERSEQQRWLSALPLHNASASQANPELAALGDAELQAVIDRASASEGAKA